MTVTRTFQLRNPVLRFTILDIVERLEMRVPEPVPVSVAVRGDFP
jgi:hypothetical protein